MPMSSVVTPWRTLGSWRGSLQDGQARVRVHVDEARGPRRARWRRSSRGAGSRAGVAPEDADRVPLHGHGGVVARVAAAVDDEAVTDQQIEHGTLLSGGLTRDRQASYNRTLCSVPRLGCSRRSHGKILIRLGSNGDDKDVWLGVGCGASRRRHHLPRAVPGGHGDRDRRGRARGRRRPGPANHRGARRDLRAAPREPHPSLRCSVPPSRWRDRTAPATALGTEAVARECFEATRTGPLPTSSPSRGSRVCAALAATLGELRLGGIAPGVLPRSMARCATSQSWPGGSRRSSSRRRSPTARRSWPWPRAPPRRAPSIRCAGCRWCCWTCRSGDRRSARSSRLSPRRRRGPRDRPRRRRRDA